jgi:acid phosphatase family membrane protein YuiD
MTHFLGIFKNYNLMCALWGFMLAQIAKFIIALITDKKIDFNKLLCNGGMPSSHSSTVCALAVSFGISHGTTDPLFAIAAVFAMVVMIDAMGVRRAAGEQAKVLNKIARDLFEKGTTQYLAKDLKEYVGHTPFQVLIGAALGIVLPFIVDKIM